MTQKLTLSDTQAQDLINLRERAQVELHNAEEALVERLTELIPLQTKPNRGLNATDYAVVADNEICLTFHVENVDGEIEINFYGPHEDIPQDVVILHWEAKVAESKLDHPCTDPPPQRIM